MSDNSTLPVAVGTEVFANNDIGGVKYPRSKVGWGAAGTFNDTSVANPFPVSAVQSGAWTVTGSISATQAGAWTVAISGTVSTGATIKAPSTAPVTSTDSGIVVCVRPDSYNPNGQTTMAFCSPVVPASDYIGPVVGSVASGVTDSGNPVKIGAQARITNPTAVIDGQRVNLIADKLGKLITVGAVRVLKGVTETTITASTAETTIVAAIAAVFCDLYGLILANSGASATKVTIKDSTAGTTRAVIQVPAGETRGFMLPVDSAIPQSAVNSNWTATCGTSTSSLDVTALWVQNL